MIKESKQLKNECNTADFSQGIGYFGHLENFMAFKISREI
jgi:hypothetical protein